MLKLIRTIYKQTTHSMDEFRALFAPAADRNKEPILQAIKNIIKGPEKSGDKIIILEISSGTGQHISHFAKNLPGNIIWQPSEYEPHSIQSICAHIQINQLENVTSPLIIDVRENFENWNSVPLYDFFSPPVQFFEGSLDYIYNANMMHITPFDCSVGLFRNAGKLLKKNGALITYGPYSKNGRITPDSNVNFNSSLKSQDSSWGLRDIQGQLIPLAAENGINFESIHDLPANNNLLVWRKL